MGTLLWTSALGGSLFFLLRVILMVAGGFDAEDFDSGDADIDADAPDSEETIATFKFLTLTGVASFFMMFGWVGLTAYEGYQLGSAISFILALLAGVSSMALVAYVFKILKQLESGGATLNQKDLLGMSAEVYESIPAGGSGRVVITVKGIRREFDASSDNEEEIKSFEKVKITALQGTTKVVVSRESIN